MRTKRTTGEIAERVLAGRPLDHIPVIDFHTHLAGSADYYYVHRSRPDQMVAYMDRFGVDHFVVFAFSLHSDCGAGNRRLLQSTAGLRGRFSPLVTLHAGFPQDWPELLEEGRAHGARGIKLIAAYQGVNEMSVDWSPALQFARGRGWVVLNHSWGTAERLENFARNFPDVTFIVGHISTGFKRLLEEYDNVYQCTCAHFACASDLPTEKLVRTLPPEKILFGSDALDLDLGTAIGPIALADIPERTKELLLGGNALELAKRLGWNLGKLTPSAKKPDRPRRKSA
ncbi:MAG: hypothetical protein A3K19_23890 [Lentisphaerae bacterium RIFOXYB12_FULL_65_16]|nr:MAG: hypothetical protein A3K18_30735 [Lentisphaerae bacterium RIFOXYA12_64_32]OGV89632.1 MAG: hypothetical protein A3K19_23890 [Lentisphaerae bacterium RIFOXYB12_FULL_65_16]